MTIKNVTTEQTRADKFLPHTLPLVLLALAVFMYAAYFTFLTVNRYDAFEARALDMGNLNQAIWNSAHGDWFRLTNQPGIVNRLSLHVEPIIIPISWLYRLWPDPRLLLSLQAAAVALGALPAYALGRSRLQDEWLALIFAAAFLLHPSIQAANWLEFHPVTLAPTFLLAAFYFLSRRRDGWFALFALLAAGCKEEIALLIFMMGLYALIAWKRHHLGVVTMVLSMGWALLAVLVIQDLFAAGNIHWERYAYLGETPGEIMRSLLTRPALVLAQLQSAHALRYILQLMLPVAFLTIPGLDLFLMALPSLAVNLLAAFPPMHRTDELIYAAPIVPFVIIGAIFGAERVLAWSTHNLSRRKRLPTFLVGSAVITCAMAAQHLSGYLPGAPNYRLYPVTDHHRTAHELIAQIPADAAVSAQDKLNPHVSGRRTVYIFPRLDDADTVFVDATGPAWPLHPNDVRAEIDRLLATGWGVAAATDGYLLLSQGEENQDLPAEFYAAWSADVPDDAVNVRVDFADMLRLVGYRVRADQHDELVTDLYWQALAPLPDDLRFNVVYLDSDGAPLHDSLFYPPAASLWYPTSLWTPGETVRVTTLPWTLDADTFTLAVGLYEGNDGWNSGRRLAITAMDPPLPRLDGGALARLGGFQATRHDDWTAVESVYPPRGTPLELRFGEMIQLTHAELGSTLVKAGDELRFTLRWQATEQPSHDYSIFIHLLDAEGKTAAQLDWQPSDPLGPRPMTTWQPSEPIVDSQVMTLPAMLQGGEYRLAIGVYDWQTGVRLPVTGADVEVDLPPSIGVVRVP